MPKRLALLDFYQGQIRKTKPTTQGTNRNPETQQLVKKDMNAFVRLVHSRQADSEAASHFQMPSAGSMPIRMREINPAEKDNVPFGTSGKQ